MLLYEDEDKTKHYRSDSKGNWMELSVPIIVKLLDVEHSAEKNIKRSRKIKIMDNDISKMLK